MNQNNLDIANGVYLPSIEACDIWEHMNRDREIYSEYVGFLPYSLELRKLVQQKEFNTFTSNRNPNKLLTRDVINVKFENIVQSGLKKKERIDKKISDKKIEIEQFETKFDATEDQTVKQEIKIKMEQIKAYINTLKEIKDSISDKWESVSKQELRNDLYENGFTITRVNKKTGEVIKDTYKLYKRTSSKSRKGQCLMIKESLYDEMIKWSRMYMDFKEGESIDLASVSSYSALVTSSIEKVIEINPENILVVDEVISQWKESDVVNVVKLVKGEVDSVPESNYLIENSIFDGEMLLDSELFDANQSMMLLRSHWTKGAAFSTHMQKFFKHYAAKKGLDYDTMTVTDLFNREINVKNIKLILNPTCIKFLKMSYLFKKEGENEKDHGLLWKRRIWDYFKGVLESEGNLWGVCKHDKTNRRGEVDGLPLQRLSYQMVNSLESTPDDIKELAKFEIEYIENLKNYPDKFIKHVKRSIKEENDDSNKIDYFSSAKMFVDLYSVDNEIIHTPAFKKFKANTIYDYVKEVKQGHLRLIGDYATLFSCPMNYLYHAAGETTLEPIGLKNNEVYTTLFGDKGFDKEFTIFRNPHTSASNIWIGKNTYVEDIKEYFDLTPNVIVINSIRENVMNRLSGCDFDSDATAVFFDETLLKLAHKSYGKYKVCVNGLEADKTEYTLTPHSMAKLDHILARATTEIGSIVNEGQLCNALYFDYLHRGVVRKDIYKHTDVLTVLSMCSIDNAKRKYKINIGSELRKIQKEIAGIVKENFEGKKPNFFKYIDKKENTVFAHYNTPMDNLYEIITNNLDAANGVTTRSFKNYLKKVNVDKANRKQRERVRELASELVNELESIHSKRYKRKEKNTKLSDTMTEYLGKIGKLKIKPDTMYSILKDIDDKKYRPIRLHLLNCLYQVHTETFLDCFKKSHG